MKSTGPGQARHHRRVSLVIVLGVGAGGVLGAGARYGVSLALPAPDGAFPWSTFIINLTGSALLGLLLTLLSERFPRGQLARSVLGTGVLGAYTTFSTFEVDALLLWRSHHYLLVALYALGSVLGGLSAVWLGMVGARLLVRAERRLREPR